MEKDGKKGKAFEAAMRIAREAEELTAVKKEIEALEEMTENFSIVMRFLDGIKDIEIPADVAEVFNQENFEKWALKKRKEIDSRLRRLEEPDLEHKTTFSRIRQGTATNTLTKFWAAISKEGKGVKTFQKEAHLDEITGTATLKKGEYTVTIPDFLTLEGVKTSTHQLLDALTVAHTEGGGRSPSVSIPLREYMEKRGIKNYDEARKQASADLETLFNAKISFQEKGKKGPKDFHDIRIIDAKGIKDGVINATFGSSFHGLLSSYPTMPYPAELWKFNSKKNPNSYYFLRKIAEHKYMNRGKFNEDVIAVKTLLDSSPCLPPFEEVMKKGQHLNQRIITPFERDMNALNEDLSWSYCERVKGPSLGEKSDLTYEEFSRLLVRVSWRQYPAKQIEKTGGESSPNRG